MYDLIDQRVDRLSHGSRFILWAMRNWTQAVAEGHCPPRILAPSFAGMGALRALSAFHLIMAFLNSEATDKLALLPNACRHIGADEAVLLTLWTDSVDPARWVKRQATLDLLVHDRSDTIGKAFDEATAALTAAELAPLGLEHTAAGSTRP